MIAIVASFTLYFYVSNRQQKQGIAVLEGLVCSRQVSCVCFYFANCC